MMPPGWARPSALGDAIDRVGRCLAKVASFGHHDGRIAQPEPSWEPGKGPRRSDLTEPQKGSPSTCRAGAMHILALQRNRTSRSELLHHEPAVGVSYAQSVSLPSL
jgi:hypothetical protein